MTINHNNNNDDLRMSCWFNDYNPDEDGEKDDDINHTHYKHPYHKKQNDLF